MWRSSKKANPTPTLVFCRPYGGQWEKSTNVKGRISKIQELSYVPYCQNLMCPEPWYAKIFFAEIYLEPLLTYCLLLYWVPPTEISATTAPVDPKLFTLNWHLSRSKIAQFERNPKTGSARKKFESKNSFFKNPLFSCFCVFFAMHLISMKFFS